IRPGMSIIRPSHPRPGPDHFGATMMGNDSTPSRRPASRIGAGNDPIRHAVEMIVKDLRKAGVTGFDAIRTEVLGAAKEALEGEGSGGRATGGDDPGATLSDAAGIFLLIFQVIGADHRDQRVQETLFVMIECAVAEVLADARG